MMKKRFPYMGVILVLILLSSACGWMISPRSALQNSPQGTVLFQDDFSRSTSGWFSDRKQGGETAYQGGVYRVYVEQPFTDITAIPGLSFKDISLDVQAWKSAGPDDNVFGVLCRYQDAQNYYFFLISSDGFYGLGKVYAGQRIFLDPTDMHPSPAILSGNQTNHIHVECRDDRLSLTVNNTLLAETHDGSLSEGDIGFLAGSLEEPGVEIHFDNLLVKTP